MRRLILWWSLVATGTVFLVLAAVLARQLQPEQLRLRIVGALSSRMNADVTLDHLEMQLVPRPRVSGSGLVIRVRDRADLPPFISMAKFEMDVGLLSITRHHVNTVHVDGLRINVPPKEVRKTLGKDDPGDDSDDPENFLSPSKVIIEHLITHDAEIAFISKNPNKRPLMFAIRDLELEDLGFDRAIPFHARLTNPLPTGLVDTHGTFGPLVKDDPSESPVKGDYVFTDADLSTINGIKGTLSSVGTFDGRISAIEASGTTKTPDFNLDMDGKPVSLETTFAALIDGSDGTVILQKVDAKIQSTALSVTGAVTNLPGPEKHLIELDVNIKQGRIEDLLTMLSAKPPMARGNLVLRTHVHLPPGKSSVLSRIVLTGQFGLASTKFRDQFQAKIQELSRRTQGKKKEEPLENVASNVRGKFTLANSILKIPDVAFEVPGAVVQLNGSSDLKTHTLALTGTLRMQATVSQAVGGFKSIFLKVADPFFRKNGAGALVPIKINGTFDAPAIGLNLRAKKDEK